MFLGQFLAVHMALRRDSSQGEQSGFLMWGFPKIMGTFLGVPIIRSIVFWGLYWGPLILGNYHVGCCVASKCLEVCVF